MLNKENGEADAGDEDQDMMDDINMEEESFEDSKKEKSKPKKQTNGKRKPSNETISDGKDDEEEKKFSHLKDEAMLKVGGLGDARGGDRTESDDDNEEEKKSGQIRTGKPKKKDTTKKATKSKVDEKQAKLPWAPIANKNDK